MSDRREEEVLERALTFTRPFTISDIDIGEGIEDVEVAPRVVRRLLASGDLRRVASEPSKPTQYEWVND